MTCYILVCFENNPERHDGIISGAQDSIGICVPGLVRHYYDNNFWPEKIESTQVIATAYKNFFLHYDYH